MSVETMIKVFVGLLIIGILTFAWSVDKIIDENGGIKQTIINFGKEVKDIGREIGKD